MTLGIMQPYFLPYLGYFQLMNAVDTFIYYDDVNFIKQGWINRNNICINNQDHRFTLELRGASSFKKINEIEIGRNREKLYKTFIQAYSKSPYFNEKLIYDIFHTGENNLFRYILYTHKLLFDYLDIDVNYLISSDLEKNEELKAQDKVIDICKRLGASTYLNAIGGQSLYSREDFAEEGIQLLFLQSKDLPKRSIIDVIMNYSVEEIKLMLNSYDLI